MIATLLFREHNLVCGVEHMQSQIARNRNNNLDVCNERVPSSDKKASQIFPRSHLFSIRIVHFRDLINYM